MAPKVNLKTVLKVVVGGFGLFLIIGGLTDIANLDPYVSVLVGFGVVILSRVF